MRKFVAPSWTNDQGGNRRAETASPCSALQPPFRRVAWADGTPGQVDIGGGRKMYLECRGTGSPTVFIVPGGRAAADEWTKGARPFSTKSAAFTRVCAYDRPGVLLADGRPSRSDPVPMPTTAADSVADLHALVGAAKIDTPFVIVGHSYGGLIVRLYAMTYPHDVDGMVLVDALSECLRAAETPEEWVWQKKNSRRRPDGDPQDLSRHRASGCRRQFRSTAQRRRRSSRCLWSC